MTAAVAVKPVAPSSSSKVQAPASTESTALKVIGQIPWQKIISTTTPYIQKYGGEALSALGSKISSCVSSGKICGSLNSCCVPKAKLPGNSGTSNPVYTPAPGNKKAIGGNTDTEFASDTACCAKCCLKACVPSIKVPDIPNGKLPNLPAIPGNKKTANGGGGLSTDDSSAIDYPNPFQEKLYEDTPAATASARRLSAAFRRRLSRVSVRGGNSSANNRSSVIYEPVAFDPNAVASIQV